MYNFIFGTFLVLGLSFYILSDGPDFVPEERAVAEAAPEVVEDAVDLVEEVAVVKAVEEEPIVEVQATRADTSALLNLSTAELTPTEEEPVFTSLATPLAEPETVDAGVEAVLTSLVADVTEELTVEVAAVEPNLDIRFVSGSRVNMRSGPGTNYSVLDTLDGGTAAEVLEVDASGWARIRLPESNRIGWMAERLLTIN